MPKDKILKKNSRNRNAEKINTHKKSRNRNTGTKISTNKIPKFFFNNKHNIKCYVLSKRQPFILSTKYRMNALFNDRSVKLCEHESNDMLWFLMFDVRWQYAKHYWRFWVRIEFWVQIRSVLKHWLYGELVFPRN